MTAGWGERCDPFHLARLCLCFCTLGLVFTTHVHVGAEPEGCAFGWRALDPKMWLDSMPKNCSADATYYLNLGDFYFFCPHTAQTPISLNADVHELAAIVGAGEALEQVRHGAHGHMVGGRMAGITQAVAAHMPMDSTGTHAALKSHGKCRMSRTLALRNYEKAAQGGCAIASSNVGTMYMHSEAQATFAFEGAVNRRACCVYLSSIATHTHTRTLRTHAHASTTHKYTCTCAFA